MHNNILEKQDSLGIYDIPAYIRRGVVLERNPQYTLVHHLDPEKPVQEPEKPQEEDHPPLVPKPEKGEGEENTVDPPKHDEKPKRHRSTISLPKPDMSFGRTFRPRTRRSY